MIFVKAATAGVIAKDGRRRFFPEKQFFNLYGPTETTVWSSVEELQVVANRGCTAIVRCDRFVDHWEQRPVIVEIGSDALA